MSTVQLDPNRFASGPEAVSVLARVSIEQDEVGLARRRHEHAQTALTAAEACLLETEALYKLHIAARDDAAAYASTALEHLDASVARLALVRAPLHPVRRTPLEVLGLIFEHCLERSPPIYFLSIQKVDVLARQLQPFRLASVCRLWRRAAITAPRVWSIIELRLDSRTSKRTDAWRSYLVTVVSRSAASALDIRVSRPGDHQDAHRQLTSAVSEQMHRCACLYVHLRRIKDYDDAVLALLQADTPALRTVHLQIPDFCDQNDADRILPASPVLHKVVANFPFCANQPKRPSVTVATLRSADFSRIDGFLGIADNVSELYLVHPALDGQSEQTTEAVSVHTLRVAPSDDVRRLVDLAHAFTFPHLSRLELYGSLRGSVGDMEFLAKVVQNSPSLAYLTVRNLNADAVDLLAGALQHCQLLKRLNIYSTVFTQEPFKRLCQALATAGEDGLWLCPALQILRLTRTCTLSRTCDSSLLARCIENRVRAAKDADDPNRPARIIAVHVRRCMASSIVTRIKAALSD